MGKQIRTKVTGSTDQEELFKQSRQSGNKAGSGGEGEDAFDALLGAASVKKKAPVSTSISDAAGVNSPANPDGLLNPDFDLGARTELPTIGSAQVAGQDIDLSTVDALPGPATSEQKAAAQQALAKRVNDRNITFADAVQLAKGRDMSPEDAYDSLQRPETYQVRVAMKDMATQIEKQFPLIDRKQMPALKSGILDDNHQLASFYTNRKNELENQLKKAQDELEGITETTSVSTGIGGAMSTRSFTDPARAAQLKAGKEAISSELNNLRQAFAKVHSFQQQRSFDQLGQGLDSKTAEKLGAEKKAVLDPIGAEQDRRRLAAGYDLTEESKFDQARAAAADRLSFLTTKVEAASEANNAQKTPASQASFDKALSQLQDEYHQFATLSDKYPEVRRSEKLQAALDAWGEAVNTNRTIRAISPLGYGVGPLRNLAGLIFNETPETAADWRAISKKTGISVDELKQLDADTRGIRKSNVRTTGLLSAIAASADNTIKGVQATINRWVGGGSSESKDQYSESLDRKTNDVNRKATGDHLFGPQTKADLAEFNADGTPNLNFGRSVINENAGKLNINPASFVNVVGETTAQMALFAAGGELAGAATAQALKGVNAVTRGANEFKRFQNALSLADDAAKAERFGEYAGTMATGFAMSYDQHYRDLGQYTGDDSKRHLGAALNAAIEGGVELLNLDLDIVRGLRGEKSFNLFDRVLKNNNGILTNKAVRQYAKGIGTMLEQQGAEGAEEWLTEWGQAIASQATVDKPIDFNQVSKRANQAFVTTFIGTLPTAAGAGFRNVGKLHKETLYEAGAAPGQYQDYIARQVESGSMGQQEADKTMRTINTMSDIVAKIPQTNIDGKPLSQEQKEELAAQELRIRTNKRVAADSTIEAEKESAEADKAEAVKAQMEILNPTLAEQQAEEEDINLADLVGEDDADIIEPLANEKPAQDSAGISQEAERTEPEVVEPDQPSESLENVAENQPGTLSKQIEEKTGIPGLFDYRDKLDQKVSDVALSYESAVGNVEAELEPLEAALTDKQKTYRALRGSRTKEDKAKAKEMEPEIKELEAQIGLRRMKINGAAEIMGAAASKMIADRAKEKGIELTTSEVDDLSGDVMEYTHGRARKATWNMGFGEMVDGLLQDYANKSEQRSSDDQQANTSTSIPVPSAPEEQKVPATVKQAPVDAPAKKPVKKPKNGRVRATYRPAGVGFSANAVSEGFEYEVPGFEDLDLVMQQDDRGYFMGDRPTGYLVTGDRRFKTAKQAAEWVADTLKKNKFTAQDLYGGKFPIITPTDKSDAIKSPGVVKVEAVSTSLPNSEVAVATAEVNATETTPATAAAEKSSLQERKAAARQKLADAMRESRGQMNAGIDPKVIIAGVEYLAILAEEGYVKFRDFVREMAGLDPSFLEKENVDTMKGLYSYYTSQLEDDAAAGYDDRKGIQSFINDELPVLITEIQNSKNEKTGDPIPGAGSGDASDTRTAAIIADEAASVGAKATSAETAPAERSDAIQRIDELVDEIDSKLSLAGYYKGNNDSAGESFTNSLAEKRFRTDLVKFSKELAASLGYEHDTLLTGSKSSGKKKKADKVVYADTNVPPAGGDGSIILWKPDSNLGVYISVPVSRGFKDGYYTDELNIVGTLGKDATIRWRVTTKANKYSGLSNQWAPGNISVGELAKQIRKAVSLEIEKENKTSQNANTTISSPTSPDQGDVAGSTRTQDVAANVPATGVEGIPDEPSELNVPAPAESDGSGDERGRGKRSDRVGNDRPSGQSSTNTGASKRPATPKDIGEPGIIENAADQNMVIPPAMEVVPGGAVAKVTANMDAILLLRKLETEERNPTPEEKMILARFVGWGGLASYLGGEKYDRLSEAIMTGTEVTVAYYPTVTATPEKLSTEGKSFDEIVDDFRKAYSKLLSTASSRSARTPSNYTGTVTLDFARQQVISQLLSEDEWNAALKSTKNAHYTDGRVIRAMWSLAERLGFQGGSVLESSAGIGHFFGMMPESLAQNSNSIGVELDNLTGRMLKKLYPQNEIYVKGFEDVNIPANSIDFAIGNVPFAEAGFVYDSRNPEISKSFSLHNYFIAKNLKLLKPGGLAILITSKSTMDAAKSGAARRWFSSVDGGNSDLVGAVRLPNNAFSDNAGTEVTTDVLVFRKRTSDLADSEPYFSTENIRAEMIDDEIAEINLNEYFVRHPENMLGEMKFAFEVGSGGLYSKTDSTLHAKPGVNVMQALQDRFASFPENIFGAEQIKEEKPKDIINTQEKAGKIFLKDGKAFVSEGDIATEVEFRYKTHLAAIQDYIPLRDAVYPLLAAELSDTSTDNEIEVLRKVLNQHYDKYVSEHGPIAKAAWIFDNDIDYPLVAALENVKKFTTISEKGIAKQNIEVKKGDMLLTRVNFPSPTPGRADNLSDAIRISEAYKGGLNLPFVAKLMDMEPEAARQQMIDEGLAYENAVNGLLESADTYLSGDVRAKLNAAKMAVQDNPQFNRNIADLEKILPLDIPAGSINFRIGVGYLPSHIYQAFVSDIIGVEASMVYSPAIGTWTVSPKGSLYDARNMQTYAAGKRTGIEIFEAVMNNRSLNVYKEYSINGQKVRELDETATAAIAEMGRKIDDVFQRFVKKSDEYRAVLEKEYNDRFNSYVEPKTSLPTFEHYPGAAHEINGKPFKLRIHQRKAGKRGVSGNTLLAHSVGTGKTYTQITIAMEARRLGTAKKPMIVVKNSTLKDFATSFKKLYPAAKILVLSKDEINAKNRKLFFGRIAVGDWDAVIIPQSQFDMIPDNPEREAQYLQEKLAEMEALADTIDDIFVKRRMDKDIEGLRQQIDELSLDQSDMKAIKQAGEESAKKESSKSGKSKAKKEGERIARMQAKVKRITDRKTDNIVDFDQMGIDMLIVDESHSYKRLGFSTNLQKVKGIDIAASKKAVSAYLKTQSVMERTGGKNVVFATGTPVTNTIAELWTNMRFLMPEKVRQMGITTFDQFQQTFTEISDSVEQNAGGNFEVVQRLSTFYNLPELVSMFRSFADVVTADDIPEFKADPDNAPPRLENDKPTAVILPITSTLRTIMGRIAEEYANFKKMSGKEKREVSWLPLVLYHIGKVSPIDPRLIDPSLGDDPGSKANAAVARAIEKYRKYTDYKAAQMIFSDAIKSSNASKIASIMNASANQPVFNLYEDIRDKLIAAGVPAHEIAIMNEAKYDNDAAKQKLFDRVNEGSVRFLLGSTDKMGVGVNAQERLIAIHHLDAPARPDQFTQRNGRIIRQGNMFAKLNIPVEVFTYGVEGTRDATGFQRLEKKQSFITQLFKGEISERSSDDAAAEDEENIDDFFASLGASLSGNREAIRLVLVKKELRREENRAFSFDQRKQDIGRSLSKQTAALPIIQKKRVDAAEHLKALLEFFPDHDINSATIEDIEVKEKIADTLDKKVFSPLEKSVKEAASKARTGTQQRSKTILINGQPVNVRVTGSWSSVLQDVSTNFYYQVPSLGIGMDAGQENVEADLSSAAVLGLQINSGSASGMLQTMRNQFRQIESAPDRMEQLEEKTKNNIAELQQASEETFDGSKLDQLRSERARLERTMVDSGAGGRWKVMKLDEDNYYLQDNFSGVDYTDFGKDTKYYSTDNQAQAIASILNQQFGNEIENTRYLVGKGDEPGTYSLMDRDDSQRTYPRSFDNYSLAQVQADIENDAIFGHLKGYKYYPVLMSTPVGRYGDFKQVIVMGEQVVDESSPSGYIWAPVQGDDHEVYGDYITAFEAAATMDQSSESASEQTLADKIRQLKFPSTGAALSTVLPVPQIWNAAIEIVAKAIEAGSAISDAMRKGYDWIRSEYKEPWSKVHYAQEMMNALKSRGTFQYNLSPTQMKEADKVIRKAMQGNKMVKELDIVRDAYEKKLAKMWQANASMDDMEALVGRYQELERYVLDGIVAQTYAEMEYFSLDLKDMTRLEKIQKQVQNRMKRLEQAQAAVEDTGKAISIDNDAVAAADTWRSKAEAKVNRILSNIGIADADVFLAKGKKKVKDSLFEKMANAGIDYRKFNLYLYALHAPERNAHNAKERRERLSRKISEIDSEFAFYDSQMTSLQYALDQAVTNGAGEEAEQMIRRQISAISGTYARAKNMHDIYHEYWSKYSDPTVNPNLVRLLEQRIPRNLWLMDDGGSGMTNDQAKEIIEQVDQEGLTNTFEQFATEFRDLVIKESLRQQVEYGLIDLSEYQRLTDYYAHYVPLMVEDTYFENKETYSSKGLPGAQIWKSKGADYINFESRVNPMTQAIVNLQGSIYDGEENAYRITLANLVRTAPDNKLWSIESANYRVITDKTGRQVGRREEPVPDDWIAYKEHGEKKYIVISDVELRKAIQEKDVKKAIPVLAQVNSYFRAFATLYNPNFILANLFRDMEAAGLVLHAEQSKEVQKNFRKNLKQLHKIFKGSFTAQKDAGNTNSTQDYWQQIAKEYRELGGAMSWWRPESTDQIREDIEADYERYKKDGGAQKGKQIMVSVFDWFNRVNGAIEETTRLSIYDAAVKAGMPKHKAVELARNATVNFNKKGNLGAAMDSLYLFANASVQGSANVLRVMLKSRRGRFLAGGLMVAGLLQSLANNWLSDCGVDADPADCYENIQDYEKEKNIIVKMPGAKGFLKIPLAYGFNIFYYAGEQIGQLVQGKGHADSSSINVGLAILNAFNPVGNIDQGVLQTISPTATDPIVQVATNTDGLGRKMHPDFQYDRRPDSEKAFSSDSEVSKEMARFFNRITGGNEKIQGAVSLSPGTIDWAAETLFGGAGRFTKQIASTANAVVKGDPNLRSSDLPIIGRFYVAPKEGSDRGIIYDALNDSYNKVLSPTMRKRFNEELDKAVMAEQFTVDKATEYRDQLNKNQFELSNPWVQDFFEAAGSRDISAEETQDFLDRIQAAKDSDQLTAPNTLRGYKTKVSKLHNAYLKRKNSNGSERE